MLVKGHVAARQHDAQQAENIYREIEHDPKSQVFLKWESEHSLAQLYEDRTQPDAAEREYILKKLKIPAAISRARQKCWGSNTAIWTER